MAKELSTEKEAVKTADVNEHRHLMDSRRADAASIVINFAKFSMELAERLLEDEKSRGRH